METAPRVGGRWSLARSVLVLLAVMGMAEARGQQDGVPSLPSGATPGNLPPVLESAFLPDPNEPGVPERIPAGVAPGLSPLGVAYESIFGDIHSAEARARWTPLRLSTYFREGWDTPFVLPSASTSGTPRQGWSGAFDGQFFRAWFLAFAYERGIDRRAGDAYLGRSTLFVPLNRRLEFQWDWRFLAADKPSPDRGYRSNLGDNTFWLKTQLSETRDFGQVLALGLTVPTGRVENGQGQTAINPSYRFLWFPGGGRWMIRGETGPVVTLDGPGATRYQNVLAAGRYFAGRQDGLLQQTWLYLVATQTSTVAGSGHHGTVCTLLPGVRTRVPGLGNIGTGLWYILANVNVPVTDPGPFRYQPIFALLYGY